MRQEEFLHKICESIADELYSAECFRKLSDCFTGEGREILLNYAQEEVEHAEKLTGIYQTLSTEEPSYVLREVEAIDDVLMFLIEYLSEEEASIFLYETLYQFTDNGHYKAIFKAIKEQEETHFAKINELISYYKKENRRHM